MIYAMCLIGCIYHMTAQVSRPLSVNRRENMMSHRCDSIPRARIGATKKSGSMNEVMINSIVLKPSDRLDL